MTQSPVIIQVVQHLRPGGIEVLCLNMLRHTQYPMHIISLEGNMQDSITNWPLLNDFKDQLHFLNKPQGFSWSTVTALKSKLKQLSASAVQTHHIGPLLYVRLASWGSSRRHVHTEHDAWHLEDRKQRWLTKLMLSSKTTLVADATSVADEISRLLGGHSPKVILNGIDTHYFTPGDAAAARTALSLPEAGFLIGCAGRLVQEKSLETVINILGQLSENVTIVVAGEGEMRSRWQDLAMRLGVSDKIIWLGHTQNMRAFYQAIDLFCMPSQREGLPLALLEAQACGKSVIATRVGGIPDLINPLTGHLFEAGDSEALLHLLNQSIAIDHPEQHNNNHEFVVNAADVRSMVHQYEQLACAK
ncbi:glycosyltransferase [Thaumasiovibrio subtropicus]|uniref:glycosyltransferase n=1 Tax=Thaumasiovibrio subtropicus TaxID=1891207 RepID=UPI000B34BC26|nr:glycosyltransferase [Thaumasiovibrio subtropicus]